MSVFAAAWLALREPVDAASRDVALARRFAAALPPAPRLIDLAAGTGAGARALAPLIGDTQDWLLIESDPGLRAAQREAFSAWARDLGYAASAAADAVEVAAAGVRWRFTDVAHDLAHDWAPLAVRPIDGVTTSAFLDLASAAWLARLAAWLAARRLPFLAALTVDGRRMWEPPAPEDGIVATAFVRDQRRDKGMGPALGDGAAAELTRALARHGYGVSEGPSDWCLGAGDGALLAALIAGEAAGAEFAVWRARRIAQAGEGTLSVTIGHRDLLALPAEI